MPYGPLIRNAKWHSIRAVLSSGEGSIDQSIKRLVSMKSGSVDALDAVLISQSPFHRLAASTSVITTRCIPARAMTR